MGTNAAHELIMETIEKTEFLFSELSDKARQKARDNFLSTDYPWYEWWGFVFDDAIAVGRLMGIEIDSNARKTTSGKTIHEPVIYFSGFSSQGDGAKFGAEYRFEPDGLDEVTAYCGGKDEELIRIARELTVMQAAQKFAGLGYFRANVGTGNSRYSHPASMTVSIHDLGSDEVGEPDEEQFTKLMRDFADWIYGQLEEQYDYLTSEECVDEELSRDDMLFDEDGNTI